MEPELGAGYPWPNSGHYQTSRPGVSVSRAAHWVAFLIGSEVEGWIVRQCVAGRVGRPGVVSPDEVLQLARTLDREVLTALVAEVERGLPAAR